MISLSALEISVGGVWGRVRTASELPRPAADSPRGPLEAAVSRALRHPPCLVTFSGGRDSSTMLALAAHVAFRDGYRPPVAVTHRFPGVDEADEAEWQEAVIAHLGLADWVKLSWTDELDWVGPAAQRLLTRDGVLFPANAHFIDVLAERAAGGALVTGIGGDELFGGAWRPRALALLYRRRRPAVRSLPALALELMPRAVRARVAARRHPARALPWLRERAARQAAWEAAGAGADAPVAWDRALRWSWGSRYTQALRATLRTLGRAHGTDVVSPFLDPAVLGAFARVAGPGGLPEHGSALTALFGDLLPAALLHRRSKATFDTVFWNRHSRELAQRWAGGGVDSELVDADALRCAWRTGGPSANGATLLMQQAWLAEVNEPRAPR